MATILCRLDWFAQVNVFSLVDDAILAGIFGNFATWIIPIRNQLSMLNSSKHNKLIINTRPTEEAMKNLCVIAYQE